MRFILLILVYCGVLYSTPAQTKTIFRETIPVKNSSADQLFNRAYEWFHSPDKMPKEALKQLNRESGLLSGTSFLLYNSKVQAGSQITKGFILYTILITVTDSSYTYEFSNFTHDAKLPLHLITTQELYPYKTSGVDKHWYNLVWNDIKTSITSELPLVVHGLKEDMERVTLTAVSER
jgi:hypothetical protein